MKQKKPFSIVHEDRHILAVNKAAGLTVGGDRWDEGKERLDRLLEAFLTERDKGENERIYTVHRIDRDTSGIVVFAKDEETLRRLSGAFEGREVYKRYIAVICGRPPWKEETCDLPLLPNGNKKHLTIIDRYQGKKSLTRFRLLGSAGNYSVAEALPETGRTHQIRVHLAALGYPVASDPLYGNGKPVFLSSIKRDWRGDPYSERPLLERLGLHAAELVLPVCDSNTAGHVPGEADPENSTEHKAKFYAETLRLSAPLSRDLSALIKQMGKCGGFSVYTP
ncbi:MAG: RNA pseudouridine synthase [Treponema sp.]|jgi:RluA family pseudouridine synthase|nr:RNA pseudouridine synthase [Treponema sp.]